MSVQETAPVTATATGAMSAVVDLAEMVKLLAAVPSAAVYYASGIVAVPKRSIYEFDLLEIDYSGHAGFLLVPALLEGFPILIYNLYAPIFVDPDSDIFFTHVAFSSCWW